MKRYIIFIILLIITLLYYFYNQNIGCKNKKAINYNENATIHDELKCRYNTLGCMDKNASNYNMYATASCVEDCIGCEQKGTCDFCKHQKKCKDHCPECICKVKVKGCNRIWALNYNSKATDDDGSCIVEDDVFKKISIISGGDCSKCSGRSYVKIGENYPILGGGDGINILVLNRDNLQVRHRRSYSTGNYETESKKFVNFLRKYIFYKDIVILTVRGDAVGKKRNINDNNQITFIESMLSDDAKLILQKLGAKTPEIAREGSYILVGSFLNDIYYETYSSNKDSYYPYFNLSNYGCIIFNNPDYEKILLDRKKLKLLDNIDLTKSDSINKCALEAIQLGYRIFSISKNNFYVYKYKNKNNELDYFKNKQFYEYNEKNKYFRLSNNDCSLNNQLFPYTKSNDESLFVIDEIYYSGLFTQFYGGQSVEIYSLKDFKGVKRELGIGIHQAWGTIPKSPNSTIEINYLPISSLKIPHNFKVTLFRNVNEDEDFSKYLKYRLNVEEDFNNFKNLDLSCCDGVKLFISNISTGKLTRENKYRTWNNIIKNLYISQNEISAKLYFYDMKIEQNNIKLNDLGKYKFYKRYNLELVNEIKSLRSVKGKNKTGYIEILDKDEIKLRSVYFTNWDVFNNNYVRDMVNLWRGHYFDRKPIPEEGVITLYLVNSEKPVLKRSTTLLGYDKTSDEAKKGFTHKHCNNIVNYSKCNSDKESFTNDIKFLIVSRDNFGITFFEDINFEGLSFTLTYGKYNLPDDLCMIIKSIKVDIKYSVIKLFEGYNFQNKFLEIRHNSTRSVGTKFSYMDLEELIDKDNIKIKSIIIEKLDFNTIISNNIDPYEYDENKKYKKEEYPFIYKLSNDSLNNLDYCYDYFKDEIILNNDDKFVRYVREEYEFGKLKLVKQIGNLNVINSGGGINYIRSKLGNNFNDLFRYFKKIKIFNKQGDLIRDIYLLNGKILYNNNNFIEEFTLDKLVFNKSEYLIRICEFDNEENVKIINMINAIKLIDSELKKRGKYVGYKKNNNYIRIDYDELDFTDRKVNLYLTDEYSKREILIKKDITNAESENEYDLHIIERDLNLIIPEVCICKKDDEYDIINFYYKEIVKYNFNNIKYSLILAPNYDTLRELNLLENNNYEVLNNINNSKFESPCIVQILNDNFDITKTIYFNCNKYVMNNNINTLNIIDKDISINKNEKNVNILMRDLSNKYNNFEFKFEKKFNLRQSIKEALDKNINLNINLINNKLGDEGYFETYDTNNVIIRRNNFSNNMIEDIGYIKDIKNLNFNVSEKIIKFYDMNNKKISTFNFFKNLNSINESLKFYLNNRNCYIKLYDINLNLVKIGLCKNNKYLFKINGKKLDLDKKYDFNKINWINSVSNYVFDLEDNFMSIELENGQEILFISLVSSKIFTSLDDLIKEYGYNNNIRDYILNFLLKRRQYSKLLFYDYDNNISKTLTFCMEPIINYFFGSPVERNAILLYNNPIKYLEIYKNNIKYKFFDKNNLVLELIIPDSMDGVYSYKVKKKIKFVNKVICLDKRNVKLYDEEDKLLDNSSDNIVHNYILGIEIINYNKDYILEYYPKINKKVIKLINFDSYVNRIEEESLDGKSIIIDNNYHTLNIRNLDEFTKIKQTELGGHF